MGNEKCREGDWETQRVGNARDMAVKIQHRHRAAALLVVSNLKKAERSTENITEFTCRTNKILPITPDCHTRQPRHRSQTLARNFRLEMQSQTTTAGEGRHGKGRESRRATAGEFESEGCRSEGSLLPPKKKLPKKKKKSAGGGGFINDTPTLL